MASDALAKTTFVVNAAAEIAGDVPIIGQALSLLGTVLNLASQYAENDERTKELFERMSCFDEPLRALQGPNVGAATYEKALERFIRLLEDCQDLINRSQNATKSGKLKRFFSSGSIGEEFTDVNKRLDTSLLDLQMALQAAGIGNEEERAENLAAKTAEHLQDVETKRLKEDIHTCVQCGQEFRLSANGHGHCKFHKGSIVFAGNMRHKWECCPKTTFRAHSDASTVPPCSKGHHREDHHTDYMYFNFQEHCGERKKHDVKEIWMEIEREDFEDGKEKWAMVGLTKEKKLFVACGKGGFVYYFWDWSVEDLKTVALSNKTKIFRLEDEFDDPDSGSHSFVHLEWQTDATGEVKGVSATVKAKSSEEIFKTLQMFYVEGEEIVQGEQKNLETSSSLPDKTRPQLEKSSHSGWMFPKHIFQDQACDNSNTKMEGDDMKFRVKFKGPTLANNKTSPNEADNFDNEIILIHSGKKGEGGGATKEERLIILKMVESKKLPVDDAVKLLGAVEGAVVSDDDICIIDIQTEVLRDGKEWIRCEPSVLLNGELPIELKPHSMTTVNVRSMIPCADKINTKTQWFYRACGSRLEPTTVRLTFEDISGRKNSVVFGHGNRAESFPSAESDDWGFGFVDDPKAWERYSVKIGPPQDDNSCFYIKARELMLDWSYPKYNLRAMGYEAWKALTKSADPSKKKARFAEWKVDDFSKNEESSNIVLDTVAIIDLLRREVCGFTSKLSLKDNPASKSVVSWYPDGPADGPAAAAGTRRGSRR